MCCWYSAPKPRSNCGGGRFHAARRRASSSSLDLELELARRDVELDQVAVAHERQAGRRRTTPARRAARTRRSSCRSCAHRRCAPCRARLAASSFFGIGSWPHSGMPGAPSGPAFCSTSTESGVDGERRIVDARRHVVVVGEHDGAARVLAADRGSAAAGLITAPSGARLPRSTARLPLATSALVARQDHVGVEDFARRRCSRPASCR